jgi:hypothetical protein
MRVKPIEVEKLYDRSCTKFNAKYTSDRVVITAQAGLGPTSAPVKNDGPTNQKTKDPCFPRGWPPGGSTLRHKS